jgi:hypothetical protein
MVVLKVSWCGIMPSTSTCSTRELAAGLKSGVLVRLHRAAQAPRPAGEEAIVIRRILHSESNRGH